MYICAPCGWLRLRISASPMKEHLSKLLWSSTSRVGCSLTSPGGGAARVQLLGCYQRLACGPVRYIVRRCATSTLWSADMTETKSMVEKYMDGFRKSDHELILSCLTDDRAW